MPEPIRKNKLYAFRLYPKDVILLEAIQAHLAAQDECANQVAALRRALRIAAIHMGIKPTQKTSKKTAKST